MLLLFGVDCLGVFWGVCRKIVCRCNGLKQKKPQTLQTAPFKQQTPQIFPRVLPYRTGKQAVPQLLCFFYQAGDEICPKRKLPLGAGGSWPGIASLGLGESRLAPRSCCCPPNHLVQVSPVTDGTWWDETRQPLCPSGARLPFPACPQHGCSGGELMVQRRQRLEPPRSQAGPDSPGLALPRLPGGFQGRKRDREAE